MRSCLILLAVVACGGGGTQLPRDRASEPGAALFNGYTRGNVRCYECHGGDGAGTKWGPALAQRVPKLSDDQVRQAIVDGKGEMPAFGFKITASEVETLVGWLRVRFDRGASAGGTERR